MPKYYDYKVAGYYLYFTSFCVVECMHVQALFWVRPNMTGTRRFRGC